jgi:hypothetical protein
VNEDGLEEGCGGGQLDGHDFCPLARELGLIQSAPGICLLKRSENIK